VSYVALDGIIGFFWGERSYALLDLGDLGMQHIKRKGNKSTLYYICRVMKNRWELCGRRRQIVIQGLRETGQFQDALEKGRRPLEDPAMCQTKTKLVSTDGGEQ
jgi:hypothetical protein